MTATAPKTHSRTRRIIWVACVTGISLIGFLAFFSAWWYVYTYGRIGFDSIMFTLTGNLNGVNSDHLISYLLGGALPAILCTALGCTIEGNRLGLGTNLFSAEPTLMEQYGYEDLCRELNKRSDFYEDNFYQES